jgi:protein lifeguard
MSISLSRWILLVYLSLLTSGSSHATLPALIRKRQSTDRYQYQYRYRRTLYNVLRGGGAYPSTSTSTSGANTVVIRPGTTHYDPTIPTTIDTKVLIDAFLTRDSRNTFIARVYTILSGQLFFTALSIGLFGMNPSWSRWMRMTRVGQIIPLGSLLLSTLAWFVTAYSSKTFITWLGLVLFTLGESIVVGFLSSQYIWSSVVTAMSVTAIATLAISAYTIWNPNPTYDLSQWGAGLSSCGLMFLLYGIIHLLETMGVLPQGFLPFRETIFSFFGAALFSMYLAYHTKLIVAGKHTKYQMKETEYVFGAMSLYNDIINMFLYLLRLMGEDRK